MLAGERTNCILFSKVDQKQILYFLIDLVSTQGAVQMFGVQSLKLFTRKIVCSGESELDVSAPRWNQQYEVRVTIGRNGEPGFDGIDGPRGN